MSSFLNTTGKRIRILRQEREMKQDAVALELKKMGIDIGRSHISKLETDPNARPSAQVIAGLAQVLNTTTDYLLLLTDDPFVPGDEDEDAQPSNEPLSPEIQARIDRLKNLPEFEQQFILKTMDDLLHFAEDRPTYETRKAPTTGQTI